MGNRLGSVIREGDWKLIRNYYDNSLELYNLSKDLSEKRNLAQQQPKLAARLNLQLGKWLKETNAPMPRSPSIK
jgi:arylsulfatase A-like enzyme